MGERVKRTKNNRNLKAKSRDCSSQSKIKSTHAKSKYNRNTQKSKVKLEETNYIGS